MQSQAQASPPPQRIELTIQSPPTGSSFEWVEVATAFAWPLVIAIVVVVLRDAIADTLRGLSERATSLSLGIVAFDLGAAAAPALAAPSLDDIRDAASHAPVADSSQALARSLSEPGSAECTVIDVGQGNEWITSRLYAVATLVARMRGLRVMVFTATGPSGQQFLGIASVAHVRWSLAKAFPWLERAYLRAWNSIYLDSLTVQQDGKVDPQVATSVLEAFKRELTAHAPQPAQTGWVDLGYQRWEHAEWLTPPLVSQVLGDQLVRASVVQDFGASDEELGRHVLRFPHEFVPIVDRAGVYQRVISRAGYVNRVLKHVADKA